MKTWILPQIQELFVKDTKGAWKHEYLCKSCGFETITFQHYFSLSCPYCGEKMVMNSWYSPESEATTPCPCGS